MLRRQRPAEIEGSNRHPFTIQLFTGATVADLLNLLDVGRGYVGAVAVNGQAAEVDSPLYEGDDIRLFPPSAGG